MDFISGLAAFEILRRRNELAARPVTEFACERDLFRLRAAEAGREMRRARRAAAAALARRLLRLPATRPATRECA
jgi:hypothetical protein